MSILHALIVVERTKTGNVSLGRPGRHIDRIGRMAKNVLRESEARLTTSRVVVIGDLAFVERRILYGKQWGLGDGDILEIWQRRFHSVGAGE